MGVEKFENDGDLVWNWSKRWERVISGGETKWDKELLGEADRSSGFPCARGKTCWNTLRKK